MKSPGRLKKRRTIQHEFYQEFLGQPPAGCDSEMDAEGADLDGEKICGDEEL